MTDTAYLHPKTQRLNRSQKQKANRARVDALSWLAETFPEPFNTEKQVRPLKKGIMQDILAYLDANPDNSMSKTKIREAVVMFTRRMEYLVCVKCRNKRIDLQGNVVEDVSDKEAEYAAEKIRLHVESAIEKAEKPPRSRRYDACEKFPPRARDLARKYEKERMSVVDNGNNLHPSDMNYSSGVLSTPAMGQAPTQTQVTVKRKVAKRVDPDAVARLKAKLGIKKERA